MRLATGGFGLSFACVGGTGSWGGGFCCPHPCWFQFYWPQPCWLFQFCWGGRQFCRLFQFPPHIYGGLLPCHLLGWKFELNDGWSDLTWGHQLPYGLCHLVFCWFVYCLGTTPLVSIILYFNAARTMPLKFGLCQHWIFLWPNLSQILHCMCFATVPFWTPNSFNFFATASSSLSSPLFSLS